MPEKGGENGHNQTRCDENGKPPGEKEGGRWRDDEHRDDNDGPHSLKRGNGGHGNHRHEKVVHEHRAESLSFCQAGVEGGQGEFFEKEGNDEDVEKKGGGDDEGRARDLNEVFRSLEKGDEIEGGVFERSVKDTGWIEVHMISRLLDENETDGKKSGEDDAHRRAAFHLAEAGDPLGKKSGENPRDRCSKKHPPTRAAPRDEKSNRETREDGVADRIAHHAHPPQQQKGPRQGAGQRAERAYEDDV